MNEYAGNWISLENLERELQTGDLVMLETLNEVIVVSIHKIINGELWHYNDWVISRKQIIAVKA